MSNDRKETCSQTDENINTLTNDKYSSNTITNYSNAINYDNMANSITEINNESYLNLYNNDCLSFEYKQPNFKKYSHTTELIKSNSMPHTQSCNSQIPSNNVNTDKTDLESTFNNKRGTFINYNNNNFNNTYNNNLNKGIIPQEKKGNNNKKKNHKDYIEMKNNFNNSKQNKPNLENSMSSMSNMSNINNINTINNMPNINSLNNNEFSKLSGNEEFLKLESQGVQGRQVNVNQFNQMNQRKYSIPSNFSKYNQVSNEPQMHYSNTNFKSISGEINPSISNNINNISININNNINNINYNETLSPNQSFSRFETPSNPVNNNFFFINSSVNINDVKNISQGNNFSYSNSLNNNNNNNCNHAQHPSNLNPNPNYSPPMYYKPPLFSNSNSYNNNKMINYSNNNKISTIPTLSTINSMNSAHLIDPLFPKSSPNLYSTENLFTPNPSCNLGYCEKYELMGETEKQMNPVSKIDENVYSFNYFNKLHNDIIDYSANVDTILNLLKPTKQSIIKYLENLIKDTFGIL